MTAAEARDKSRNNDYLSTIFKEIIKQIDEAASKGETSIRVVDLHHKHRLGLIDLGYTVSFEDNGTMQIIEW